MTVHFRKVLRDKAASLLTDLTTTETRVFSGRTRPLGESDMPGLVIVPGSENAEYDTQGDDGAVQRQFSLLVMAEVMGNDGLYDSLDTIAAEVETALFDPLHRDLDGLALNIEPPNTNYALSDDGGRSDKQRAQMHMTFVVHYRTETTDPTTQA